MPLTDRAIKGLKPKSKVYKVADGDNLYLTIKPTGYKVWWFQYRLNSKQKILTIGPYPTIGLAEESGPETHG